MTYVDTFDNEDGLLTGVGLLAALPLFVVATWMLGRAEPGVGSAAVDPASGTVTVVALTVAMVLLLAVSLVAFHNVEP